MNVGQYNKIPTLSEDTVAAFLVSGVLTAVRPLGLDIPACMRAAAITDSELENPTNRIGIPHFIALLLFIQEETGDDGIGLHIGRELACANYYALGYAAANGTRCLTRYTCCPGMNPWWFHRPTQRLSSCNMTSKCTGR
ncbi:MAG: AraC family transcriptional regulator ligand-binding domain-containing protein [Haliea sp.]|nr:AraC family transcriptional regulator ligand-binding domain-containing protein [Haliea sp.]